MSGRIFFIGIDSGDNVLLERWMDDGTLPNLARIRAEATVAVVKSPPELGNGGMWLNLATGVDMSHYGIHYMIQLQPGSYRLAAVDDDNDCKVPTIWRRISDAGKRCIVVDMFRSPLSKQLNGVEITEWLSSFHMHKPRSTPANAIDDICRRFGTDPFEGSADRWQLQHQDFPRMMQLYLERIESKTRAIEYLMQKESWDLLMVTYADIHDLCHLGWHLHDRESPDFDPTVAARLGDPVKHLYQVVDQAIGRLVSALQPEDTVIFYGGLGFQSLYSVGKLFEEIIGRLHNGTTTASSPNQRMTLARKIATFRPSFLRKVLPTSVKQKLGRLFFNVGDAVAVDVRRNSRFFVLPCEGHAGAVRVNLVGRDPDGKVPLDQYTSVLDEIESGLLDVLNAETGKPLVSQVVRTHDHYHGPHLDIMPDLFIVWDRSAPIRVLTSPKIGSVQVHTHVVRTGDHTSLSYLMMKGPGLAAGRLAGFARPEDVGATIMSLAGCEPTGLDGHILVST